MLIARRVNGWWRHRLYTVYEWRNDNTMTLLSSWRHAAAQRQTDRTTERSENIIFSVHLAEIIMEV